LGFKSWMKEIRAKRGLALNSLAFAVWLGQSNAMTDVVAPEERYQLHLLLLDVGPSPWRRLLIRPDTTVDGRRTAPACPTVPGLARFGMAYVLGAWRAMLWPTQRIERG
jgi:hypothetical protein